MWPSRSARLVGDILGLQASLVQLCEQGVAGVAQQTGHDLVCCSPEPRSLPTRSRSSGADADRDRVTRPCGSAIILGGGRRAHAILCRMAEKTRVSSSTRIAASADTIYALVSDLTRMGEWSPEATGGRWMGGATGPAKGAKFKGTNDSGKKTWSVVSTVTDATAPTRFEFANVLGPKTFAVWSYEITPVDGGGACEVTETWVDGRGPVTAVLGKMLTGVDDRIAHTQSMIETTLARLKETAEAGG